MTGDKLKKEKILHVLCVDEAGNLPIFSKAFFQVQEKCRMESGGSGKTLQYMLLCNDTRASE